MQGGRRVQWNFTFLSKLKSQNMICPFQKYVLRLCCIEGLKLEGTDPEFKVLVMKRPRQRGVTIEMHLRGAVRAGGIKVLRAQPLNLARHQCPEELMPQPDFLKNKMQ